VAFLFQFILYVYFVVISRQLFSVSLSPISSCTCLVTRSSVCRRSVYHAKTAHNL